MAGRVSEARQILRMRGYEALDSPEPSSENSEGELSPSGWRLPTPEDQAPIRASPERAPVQEPVPPAGVEDGVISRSKRPRYRRQFGAADRQSPQQHQPAAEGGEEDDNDDGDAEESSEEEEDSADEEAEQEDMVTGTVDSDLWHRSVSTALGFRGLVQATKASKLESQKTPAPAPAAAPASRVKLAKLVIDSLAVEGMIVAGFGAKVANLSSVRKRAFVCTVAGLQVWLLANTDAVVAMNRFGRAGRILPRQSSLHAPSSGPHSICGLLGFITTERAFLFLFQLGAGQRAATRQCGGCRRTRRRRSSGQGPARAGGRCGGMHNRQLQRQGVAAGRAFARWRRDCRCRRHRHSRCRRADLHPAFF